MKNYTIKIIDKKTKRIISEFSELSNTKKYLQKNMKLNIDLVILEVRLL